MEQKRIDRITKVSKLRHRDIIVVLEDIHDPHNASAILRTCDALGIQQVWFIFGNEKPYNPKRVGKASSSSANKWLDFRVFHSTESCIDALKEQEYSIAVTALSPDAISLYDYMVPDKKIAVFVGNEHDGVSDTALRSADTVLMIPMAGFVQSLNVSVATAIVLWEITKQRKTSGIPWQLPQAEQHKLLKDFLERATK